jgi:PIN domain nuclease of toxin-antitoxin system
VRTGRLKAIIQQPPIQANHLLALGKLTQYHQDPFDRMLIAQAINEPMHLLTHEKKPGQIQ